MPGHETEQQAQQAAFTRKDYQPEVTTVDLAGMVNGHLNTLLEAMQQGNTEHLTSYLAFSSRFHRYSRRNQELIYEQCPEATQVARYQKWKQEGYQVRFMNKDPKKGSVEHGIRILVPVPPAGYKAPARRTAEPESEEQREITYVTTHFKVGTVFDVSHLIPEDQKRVPQFFPSIYGDHEALHQRIVGAIQAEGIAYRETVDTQGARGYSAGGLIVVQAEQPPGNKAAVAVHEWAHEHIHDEEKRRKLPSRVKEAHAEATAFIVLSHFGVAIPYSSDYLLHWGNTPKTLKEELEVVTSAASHIIQKLHALEPGESHFHDQA